MKYVATSVVVVLCIWCVFALGNPPEATWQPSWPEAQASAETQSEADQNVGRAEKSPLFVRIEKTEEETANEENDRTERANASSDTSRIGWLTFAILLIQAAVFMYQGRQLRSTVDEMRIATRATESAANAAKKSADIAEATLEATNRPWIMITSVVHDTVEQGPVIRKNRLYLPVIVSMKNVGNSPAIHLKTFVVTLFDYKGGKRSESWSKSGKSPSPMRGSNGKAAIPFSTKTLIAIT